MDNSLLLRISEMLSEKKKKKTRKCSSGTSQCLQEIGSGIVTLFIFSSFILIMFLIPCMWSKILTSIRVIIVLSFFHILPNNRFNRAVWLNIRNFLEYQFPVTTGLNLKCLLNLGMSYSSS